MRTGRVTRVAEFGAFVELEPGIEGLAHASTFPPTGRAGGWAKSVPVGTTGAFEILSIDPAQKRIGVALVEEATSRAAGATAPQGATRRAGTIVTGKVERHEKFGVFVFLSPGRTGLMPFAETGLDRDADMLKAFPIGSEVEVAVLEVDPAAGAFASAGRRWRSSASRRSCASTPPGRTPRPRRRWDRWPTSCATPSEAGDAVHSGRLSSTTGSCTRSSKCSLPWAKGRPFERLEHRLVRGCVAAGRQPCEVEPIERAQLEVDGAGDIDLGHQAGRERGDAHFSVGDAWCREPRAPTS